MVIFEVVGSKFSLLQVHSEIRHCWYNRRRHERVYTRTFAMSSVKRSSYISNSTYSRPAITTTTTKPGRCFSQFGHGSRGSVSTISGYVPVATRPALVTEPVIEDFRQYEGIPVTENSGSHVDNVNDY